LSQKDQTEIQAVTRQSRRLYIGNLPISIGITEALLTEYFELACKEIGITREQPILSSWLSGENTFGFVEFRSIMDCTLALTRLQGLSFCGRLLRIGRPQVGDNYSYCLIVAWATDYYSIFLFPRTTLPHRPI
jgi:RNA recognition motif-containing protein